MGLTSPRRPREGHHGDRLHRRAAGAEERAAGLLRETAHPRDRGRVGARRWHRPRGAQGGPADGGRRLARHRLAQGVGWAGPLGHRAVHLLRRVDAQWRAGAHADHQHGRADHHAVRDPGAEGLLPPEDPGRGDPLLHRLHGAQRGNRPGVFGDQGRTRRRGVRDQRVQGVHQPGQRRRLHLVGHAHGSERLEAQGDLHVPRPHGHPGYPRGADEAAGRSQHQLHLLRGRPRPGHQPRGRRERRLEDHHQPAEPRAGDAVRTRDGGAVAAGRQGLGAGDQAARRPPRHRPGVGAGAPGPRLCRVGVPTPHQLEGGVAGDAGAARRR